MEHIVNLIVNPLVSTYHKVLSFGPAFVSLLNAIVILMIGIVVAKFVKDMFDLVFRKVELDKYADKLKINQALYKGGVKTKLSGILSSLLHLVIIISFIILTVESVGLTMMAGLIDRVLGYIPRVLSAAVILVIGILLAHIVGKVVHVFVSLTGMPRPDLGEKIAKWAIVLHAVTMSMDELGYGAILTGTSFLILFGGFVFALALAYGLRGKNFATGHIGGRKK